MAERKLPQNLEAEMSILGACFLSQSALDKVCEEVNSDMFFSEANRIIFDAIYELHQNNKPLDTTVLINEIEKHNNINSIGGVEYLGEVVDSVITAANIDYYIDIVREKALRRRLVEVSTSITTSCFDESIETNDVVDNAEKNIFTVTKARKAGEFKSIGEIMKTTQERIEDLAKNDKEITGISTGFYDFDKLTSGLHENELIIIAARPAMGKTAFAVNLAVNAAISSKKNVALFNMEMSATQLAMRMISSIGGIDQNKLKTGRLEHNDWKKVNEAISELSNTNLFIEDASGISVSEIRAKCRRLAAQGNGLGLVVIDYLQLIEGTSKYAGNRQQEVSEISRSLKTMAMELSVPVVALAQLSRSVELRENKRPIMSDLRESGSIEQDADIVAFLYRDDYYNKSASEQTNISVTELIVGKHRNGNTGTIELLFERNMSNFRNYIKSES